MNFRKTIMICTLLLISSFIFGQDAKDAKKNVSSTFQTGVLIKITDYPLPEIQAGYRPPVVKKVIRDNEVKYYYELLYLSVSIESENIPDLIKAIERLKNESKKDLVLKPKFVLNKYITLDDFEISYEVSDNSLKWYIGSKYERSIEVVTAIQSSLELALTKIDSLKNN